ncbi:MAG TPA: peptidase [Treponemataceae bacterium]|nr:peptidase [Treponemataceae bacterium]
MLCRFTGEKSFHETSAASLFEFLRRKTTESGLVKTPFEIVLSGFIDAKAGETEDVFPWVFSTFDTDRYDEKVDPKGWELERYLENPVVLWAHCHSIPAIGKASDLAASDFLSGNIRFNEKDYDEFGWSIGERVKRGVIRAGSVGMLVKEIEWLDRKAGDGDEADLIIRKQELLEFSICNVPANPFALQTSSLGEFPVGKFSTANPFEQSIRGEGMRDRSGVLNGSGDPTAGSKVSGFWPLCIQRCQGGVYGR